MEASSTINQQNIEFWSWRGTVTATWAKNAGGSTEGVEVRLQGEGEEKRTLVLPAPATAAEEDVVTLLYARQSDEQKGPLVGIVNHSRARNWVVAKAAGPVQYRHPLLLKLVKKVDRYGLFGIAFILSAITAFVLYLQTEITFSLVSWASICIAEFAVLWLINALANARQKRIDRAFAGEVEGYLKRISYEPIEPAVTEEETPADA